MVNWAHDEADAELRSQSVSPQQMARWCLGNVGQRESAVGLGLTDAGILRRYVQGEETLSAEQEGRLRLLYRVASMIERAGGAQTARAFLRGSNPLLGDVAPLAVIADRSATEATAEVLAAARALLED